MMSTSLCFFALLAQIITSALSQEMCSNTGDVRLVGSVNMTEGRLEICVDGYWGTVCNDGPNDIFDRNAAEVVCRQLGFPESVLPEIISDVFFGGGGSFTPIHLDDLRCLGNESSLLTCTHGGIGVHDCDHQQDVGIICQRSQDCTDGSVRLVDGDNYVSRTAGRVEYCVGGLWGTVCNYLWSEADVAVVCQQLGLNTGPLYDPKILHEVPQVNDIRTPIVLDGLNCRISDPSLGQCDHLPVVEYCSHSDDAGAFCVRASECNDTDVRLVQLDGDKENEGRVEYCNSGRWSLVCYDSWDTNDARVICRQLGYNVEAGSVVVIDTRVLPGAPPTVLNEVNCVGTEESISQCPQDNSRECYNLGAGVICPILIRECTDREVRLRGGDLSDRIGGVEVCMAGRWGLVCDDYWDDTDASVICRQLGYTGGVAITKSIFGITNDGFFILDDVNCTGNESNVFDCPHPLSTNCRVSRSEEAGVICGGTKDGRCTEDLLINDTISLHGSNFTNLTAGSIGICHSYLGQSNLCNSFFEPTDYIFTTMDQLILSTELDERILPVLRGLNEECGDLIYRLLCHYFFAPCGANSQLHLPLAVCPDECHYVQTVCQQQWGIVNHLLSTAGLSNVSCSATSALLQGLAPCCIDAGIQIEEIRLTTVNSLATEKGLATESSGTETSLGLVIGLLVAFLIILIAAASVTICLATVVIRKRKDKATIRSLQLEVLTSPTRTTMEPLTGGFLKNIDETEFGGDIKLRRNGSQHAIPNPYSTKQELGLPMHMAMLSPTDNQMMNRISSSIIRELSSNMLIPYSRLKLLECVGQGEFGVVYKAQHTEPEGDIGYKTSTVAVKTLKGFFDNSQVNKIMEESIKMKHFDHPNVLHLIGVCLDAGPAPYVVMPYMANGSLLHYLKKERNNLVLPVGVDDDVKIEVRKRLTVMCLQIASGMEYLAGEKFIHRDLAARNCMIDIHFVIKIADFGLSEDVYAKNYFRQSGSDKSIKLPVKWMAPESLSDGIFSEKSDVWSFGVTCWEIFNGGKTPYPGVDPLLLSQMLDTEQRLNKPLNAACPDEVYSLMMKCWSKLPDDRPPFSEIVTIISKYTECIAGYLDINFNPFKSTHDLTNTDSPAATSLDSPEDEKDVLITAELLAKLNSSKQTKDKKKSKSPKGTPKASPRASPRPSPRASPRISPRASPLLKIRKLKEDQISTTSSAGIQICIESPSEDGSVTSGLLSVK